MSIGCWNIIQKWNEALNNVQWIVKETSSGLCSIRGTAMTKCWSRWERCWYCIASTSSFYRNAARVIIKINLRALFQENLEDMRMEISLSDLRRTRKFWTWRKRCLGHSRIYHGVENESVNWGCAWFEDHENGADCIQEVRKVSIMIEQGLYFAWKNVCCNVFRGCVKGKTNWEKL